MGFAFEHRGREPERTFRNDRYSDFNRGPGRADPRVPEERERALLRAAFAASRKLDPQEATRPALAEKLNGPQAAGLVLQREPIREQEPETIQRQVSGITEEECYDIFLECLEECSEATRGNPRDYPACQNACMQVFGRCRAEATGRRIIDETKNIKMLVVLAIALGLIAADGPIPAGDVLAALLLAHFLNKSQQERRRPRPQ